MSRYRAFISYRQVNSDRTIAVWLHKSLEAYRTPRGLVKTGTRPRAGTIFRDEEELYASSNLLETIRSALRESDYLVVVCSPRSAASKWVNAEIKYFREIGRGDRILPLLVEGTPQSSFSSELLHTKGGTDSAEPLAADIRPMTGAFHLSLFPPHHFLRALLNHVWMYLEYLHRRKLALLRILAPLLECGFDDLRQRELIRMRRRRRAAAIMAFILLLIGGGVLHSAVETEILELASYSRDNLEVNPSLSVLLSKMAFDKSNRWLGLGGPIVRRTLEEAVYRSRLLAQFQMPARPAQALAWHTTGIIAAGDDRGNVKIWNRSTGEQVNSHSFESGIQKVEFRPSPSMMQLAVVIGSVSRLAPFTAVTVIQMGDRSAEFWDLKSGAVVRYPLLHATSVTSPADISWCSDGMHLAGSPGIGDLLVWDLSKSSQPISVSIPNSEPVQAIKWGFPCTTVYMGTPRGLYKWVWNAGQPVSLGTRCGEGNLDTVNAGPTIAEGVVALDVQGNNDRSGSDDIGDTVATGDQSGVVCVGGASDSQPLSGHVNSITAVAWNHRGTRLATASLDGTVRIWSVPENSVQYRTDTAFYTNHGQSWAIAWSPDDRELATTGDDGTVRVWSVAGPSEKRYGKRTGVLILDEKFGLLLDNQPVTARDLRELAQERSVQKLTDDECQKYLHSSSCPR